MSAAIEVDLIDSRRFAANRIHSVVRSAARRRFAVLTVEQLAFALAPVLGGAIILLLVGTQILAWYWLALLATAGLGIAAFRIRARSLSHYRTAQVLDKRLNLSDSVSTAWFLLNREEHKENGIAAFQLQQAEQLAAAVHPAEAFPLAWHRAWAITGALAVIAFGLFGVRYLITRSLSFEQSLIPVQITPVFERLESRLFANNRLPGDPLPGARTQQKTDQSDGQLPDQKTVNIPRGQVEETGQSTDPNGKAASRSQTDAEKNANPQNGDVHNSDGDSPNPQAGQKNPDQSAGNQANPQNGDPKQQATSGQQGAQGLVDKMKDALSSLMAKMHQNSTQQSQPNGRPSDEDKAGSQSSAKAQPGQQQDARNAQSSQDQSSEGQPQAQAAERTQASQGHSSDSMPEKGADAHSGIGRQDGDKNVKQAEQLQAMGKLAEIIGKRSANLTGDMMVETLSGKQQLKTAYSQKLGHHSDSGGEINRDEVPLADQQYVREYMELVRKQGKTEK